jgi:tetratricopeptide (TPR) repeat protein
MTAPGEAERLREFAPLIEVVEHWETMAPAADPGDSEPLLDALEPLVEPVDLGPLRAGLVANDPRAFGAVAALRRAAVPIIERGLRIGGEHFSKRAFNVLLHGLSLLEALAAATGQRKQLALAEMLRARALREQSNPQGALAAYTRALAVVPQTEEEMRSVLHDNRGNLLREVGEFDAALDSFAAATQLEKNPRNRAIILRNRAEVYRVLGERDKAARLEEEAAVLIRGTKPTGYDLDEAAERLGEAGKLTEALDLNAQAGGLFGGGPLKARATNALIRAILLKDAGQTGDAAAAFRTALKIFRQQAEEDVRLEDYLAGYLASVQKRLPETHPARQAFYQAFLSREQGNLEESTSLLLKCAELAAAAGDYGTSLRARALLGGWWFDVGDIRRAREVLSPVQQEALDRRLALPETSALVTMAAISHSGADLRIEPLANLTRAIRLRDVMANVLAKLPMSEIERAIELNDTGTIEGQLGKYLSDAGLYAEAAGYYVTAVAKAERNGDLDRVANRLSGLRLALAKSGDTASAEAAAVRLKALLDNSALPPRGRIVAGRSLADHVRSNDPALMTLYLETAVAAAEQIRAALPLSRRAGVEREWSDLFWKLPCALRASGDTRHAFEALQLGKGRAFLEAAATRGEADDRPPALEAIQAALGSDDAVLDITGEWDALVGYLVSGSGLQIVVSPGDTELFTAPDNGDVRRRAAAMLELTRTSDLLSRFAAAVEAALPAGVGLLIVPEPRLSNLPLHTIPVDGQPWSQRRRIGVIPAAGAVCLPRTTRTGEVFIAGNSRGDLPGAEAECHEIAKLYGTLARTGQDCTAAELEAALDAGPLDVVHLAVHGRGNPRRGVQASLLMADGTGGTIWVGLDALTQRPWPVGLVVLSGCSTGLVGRREGYELVSVAGQIQQAGARAVVACLWPVGDAAAQIAMTTFHKRLVATPSYLVDVREALNEARGQLRDPAAPVTQARDGREIAPPAKRKLDPVIELGLNWSAFVATGAPYPFGATI